MTVFVFEWTFPFKYPVLLDYLKSTIIFLVKYPVSLEMQHIIEVNVSMYYGDFKS